MNRALSSAIVLVFAVHSATARAQLTGSKTAAGCIAVRGASTTVTAEGRLTLRHLPGPPNFESVRHSDEDRLTLILVLPKTVCIDDGGDFADPKERFKTVHVWSLDPVIHRKLKQLVGRIVEITGDGYASNNALHYAPLILEAKTVSARER